MNKQNREWVQTMDGREVWTNAFGKRFGERVCVGFDGSSLWCNGQQFIPTDTEIKQLRKDVLLEEYGTTDTAQIFKMEGFA